MYLLLIIQIYQRCKERKIKEKYSDNAPHKIEMEDSARSNAQLEEL